MSTFTLQYIRSNGIIEIKEMLRKRKDDMWVRPPERKDRKEQQIPKFIFQTVQHHLSEGYNPGVSA